MTRYVTKPRAAFIPQSPWDDHFEIYDPDPAPPTCTVHEPDDDGFTGLYTDKGEPLYRAKEPIGFK